MMKVLHILHHVSDSLEGWHTYIARGMSRISNQLKQVCITPTTYQTFKNLTKFTNNMIVYKNFILPFSKTVMWSRKMYTDLLKYSKSDWIIHVHGERGTIPLFLSKFTKKESKIILQQHSGISFGPSSKLYTFYKFIINSYKIKGVIVPSDTAKDFLKYNEVKERKIFPLTPGVGYDELTFKPIDKKEAREILGLRKDAFIMLYVGRFNNVKGFGHILDVTKELKNKGVLLLAVGGNPKEQFGNIFNKNLDYVKPFSRLNRENLRLFYAASDCFIWICEPWVAYLGGIGVSVLEAMAMGCPVISSTLTLLNEDEINLSGYVVHNKDEALYAVNQIMSGKKGFNPRKVAENYNLSKYCQRILKEVYANI